VTDWDGAYDPDPLRRALARAEAAERERDAMRADYVSADADRSRAWGEVHAQRFQLDALRAQLAAVTGAEMPEKCGYEFDHNGHYLTFLGHVVMHVRYGVDYAPQALRAFAARIEREKGGT
jgi:outer membrane protein TolC